MQSSIAKWGNSLAVRLPAECLRAAGLREGAVVDVELTPAGEITLTPVHAFDKKAFLKRLAVLRRGMPTSAPVVEQMRRDNRY